MEHFQSQTKVWEHTKCPIKTTKEMLERHIPFFMHILAPIKLGLGCFVGVCAATTQIIATEFSTIIQPTNHAKLETKKGRNAMLCDIVTLSAVQS